LKSDDGQQIDWGNEGGQTRQKWEVLPVIWHKIGGMTYTVFFVLNFLVVY
jgi:hypothetical protein